MRTIAQAVRSVIEATPVLRVGLGKGVLNLTEVARQIQPLVEARTVKDVSVQAVAMALSRLSRAGHLDGSSVPALRIDHIGIHRGLAAVTLRREGHVSTRVSGLWPTLLERGRYLTLTQGQAELMLILDERMVELVRKEFPRSIADCREGLGALAVRLPEGAPAASGVLYRILEPIAMQGVPVVEVASTTSEFHIYLDSSDLMIAADSLHKALAGDPESAA